LAVTTPILRRKVVETSSGGFIGFVLLALPVSHGLTFGNALLPIIPASTDHDVAEMPIRTNFHEIVEPMTKSV
jgi:hypothetical protein